MDTSSDPSRRVPPEAATKLLIRAASLDADMSGVLTVQQLRDIAAEAGIDPHAFDAALEELGQDGPFATGKELTVVPRWVRLGMVAVPDRQTAMRFYWIFVSLILAAPVYPLVVGTSSAASVSAAFLVFGILASWGTSRTVQWLDRHGWELLR